ncbi:MAG: hypothetical protein R3181_11800 [Rubricoccaceae bacterium]|nr:hypothetical protein [Rubricoccaceae bacterium]
MRAALLGGLLLLATAAPAAQTAALPEGLGWTWSERPLASPAGGAAVARPDRWLGPDKALHAGASFALTLAMQGAFTANGAAGEDALPVAAGMALTLGLMKELADARRPRSPLFSWRDLAADAAGVLAAAALVTAL